MIIDKYQRSLFNEVNVVNAIEEPDLITNKFLEYDFQRPTRSYQVIQQDLQRPDLISLKAYNKINLWWIIMKFNKIEDIWNDLYVGQILEIPSIQDIDEFVMKQRR